MFFIFSLGLAVFAGLSVGAETSSDNGSILNALTNMRLKQEREENNVVRVIQQPSTVRTEQVCSPVEQARQRMRDLGTSKEQVAGTVKVEAGHGDVKIDNNQGQVNNSVNVQVVNPNEKSCL